LSNDLKLKFKIKSSFLQKKKVFFSFESNLHKILQVGEALTIPLLFFRICTSLPRAAATELYNINRERHRFLGNKAEIRQHFVAFAAPSSGQIWQRY
jgi:hypothetical protein